MNSKKTLRFYIALYLAKISILCLKILKRNASFFPGRLAIKICPDFLGKIDKPKTILGVTGTNGKTTASNMLEEALKKNGYVIIDNHLGSNIDAGIASSLIQSSNCKGKQKVELAVFEIDERSAVKVYPYLTPTYLICTNLFRDSITRNAHTEFIADILTKYIPKETKLILNGDDLITSNIAPENERVYFGIDRLDTDTDTFENIVRDISVCPKCDSKLEWDFVRYNHIGRAHCPKCDFASPKLDYEVTKIDLDKMEMVLKNEGKEETYKLLTNGIINIYNMLAVISILKEIKLTEEQIKKGLEGQNIIDTRYNREVIDGIEVTTHLAKGLNPIACSRAFDYARSQPGNKVAIVLVDDEHIAKTSTENICWQYDTDYEFLNDSSIKQILVGGVRYLDSYVRLQMAGVPKDKIVAKREPEKLVDDMILDGIDKIFILHDLYTLDIRDAVKKKVILKIQGKEDK